ncbi:MAG: hypothetical protein RIM99_11820 [Cyclobacteriaceae bacterium]
MNTSNQSYKELAIPYFKEVFEIIDEVMTYAHAPYYLIGVNAIALELLKEGIKPNRGTKDIDFAVMVTTIQEYERIITELEKRGFLKVKAPWTLYHEKYKVAIDLLPFGEIEENDTVSFNERYSDLHVLGFQEVLENTEKVEIEEITIQIPPIPGMIVLKLVAWSDRPEERDNDLSDILKIFEHFYDCYWNDIMDHHHDLFNQEPFDQLKVSARILGREARRYLNKSERLKSRILKVLKENLQAPEKSLIAREWARRKDTNIQYMQEVLTEFEMGLKGN